MLLIAIGTRPELVKFQPLIKVLPKESYRILFTQQHTGLLEDAFIINDIGLRKCHKVYQSIPTNPNRLNDIIQHILNYQMDPSISRKITHIMVQGDTTSAFAVALSAFHRHIPVIHLEAGLRTFNINSPYPEEFNRRAISLLAAINLCPTKRDAQILHSERVPGDIYVTGNTVLDNLVGLTPVVSKNVLITLHRRENHELIPEWFKQINKLSVEMPDLNFILPMHPNPTITKHKALLSNVKVVDPLSHRDCTELIRTARLIITDSGGIQEEASFLRKRCVVCRVATERTASLDKCGLCAHPDHLSASFKSVYSQSALIPSYVGCPYGDGHAAEKIKYILERQYVI